MEKKGVSPIIATVLLIGMVIALSLVVFIWMRSFTQETVTKFDGENIELSCTKIQFSASMSGGTISITNIGQVPIYDFRVRTITAGGYDTESMRDNSGWPAFGLNPGDAVSLSGFSTSAEGINIIPVLLGNSDKGKKTFTCENQEYSL